MPALVVHFHLDEDITREELPLGDALLAALHFDDFFDRHQNLAELVLHPGAIDRSTRARCTDFSKPE
jgi:hypothetical protein